jgi:hypothetical protein
MMRISLRFARNTQGNEGQSLNVKADTFGSATFVAFYRQLSTAIFSNWLITLFTSSPVHRLE